jgi:hypothetical protein
MKKHASQSKFNYPIFSDAVQRVDDLLTLDFPSEKFVLFLAADFSSIDPQLIAETGKGLIHKGLVYVCTWGPDCEKAHDAFDQGSYKYEEETGNQFHLMTSWHENETIENALWYGVFSAFSPDEFLSKTATLCVTVSNSVWNERVQELLGDLKTFRKNI